MTDKHMAPGTIGAVLHAAARYDILVWLATLGRDRLFREKVLRLVGIEPGESMLDVGCGTGNLAIAAKRKVGAAGRVHGIDASREMISRAERKARKAGIEVVFGNSTAQGLPFPDAHFDAVISTRMLHHLPRKARRQCVSEMRRVAKPGGRVLVVDFTAPAPDRKGLLAHFHRHGHIGIEEMLAMFGEAGLSHMESGPVGIGDLQFVLAVAG